MSVCSTATVTSCQLKRLCSVRCARLILQILRPGKPRKELSKVVVSTALFVQSIGVFSVVLLVVVSQQRMLVCWCMSIMFAEAIAFVVVARRELRKRDAH
ncbi:TPA: hypothetical protein ACH3X1_012901 [Trebouxia sp. C0004]